MRTKALLLSAGIAATLALPAAAVPLQPGPAADTDAVHSENMRHVQNLEYAERYGSGKNQGTDLEFADLDIDGETRTFAFAGSYDNGLQIVDVTDPEAAEIVAAYDCGVSQGDVQIFTREVDEATRTYVAYTQDTFYALRRGSQCVVDAEDMFGRAATRDGTGTYIADVTDPYNPVTASYVPIPKGSHNQTVHPSGDYLYNSNSELIIDDPLAPGIEVYDIRDLTAPALVTTLELPIRPGLGTESHDVTFNADGTRAYSAALSQTVIIDTTDPENPSIVSSFVDPAITLEHQANTITIDDPLLGAREFLVVEDEVGGAAGATVCPTGGVHVYDITGDLEETPVKVGFWNIDEVRSVTDPTPVDGHSCTAHVFQLFEEEAIMLIAFYNGGVRVVDLSGLVGVALGGTGVGMTELGFYRFSDSNTWAVKAPSVDRENGFYLYGNDMTRGMDIFHFAGTAGDAAPSEHQGAWLSPAEALAAARSSRPSVSLTADSGPFCLLR